MSFQRSPRSYSTERNFGLVVGSVFALLGGWWLYRHKFPHAAPVAVSLGAILIVFGAVFPRALVWPNRAWMGLAEVMSYVMTRVIMSIVFFVTVTPIGIVKRLTGWDPLRRRAASVPSYWEPYPERQRDPKHYEKMY